MTAVSSHLSLGALLDAKPWLRPGPCYLFKLQMRPREQVLLLSPFTNEEMGIQRGHVAESHQSAQLAVAVPICVTPTPLNHEGEGAVGAPLWVQPG